MTLVRIPLGNKDKLARDNLIPTILSIHLLSEFPILERQINDVRNAINEFPKKVAAIALHRKFFINAYLTGYDKTLNVYIECTIVNVNYEVKKILI